MIKYTDELVLELNEYKNPYTKIARLVNENKLFKIKQGVFETDRNANPFCVSSVLYGPSYISFQTALAYYNLIPERVYAITCATSQKRKTKSYNNEFGTFIYKDVPKKAYPYGINRIVEGEYCYYIASIEKCITDMLYEYTPATSIKEIEYILFNDLRIDEDIFNTLNKDELIKLSELYNTTNHKLFIKLLRRRHNGE